MLEHCGVYVREAKNWLRFGAASGAAGPSGDSAEQQFAEKLMVYVARGERVTQEPRT